MNSFLKLNYILYTILYNYSTIIQLHKIDIIICIILLYKLKLVHIHNSVPLHISQRMSKTGSTAVLIDEYIQTLNAFEQQGLAIAKDHLGPSFDMKRSIGFLRWKDLKNKK